MFTLGDTWITASVRTLSAARCSDLSDVGDGVLEEERKRDVGRGADCFEWGQHNGNGMGHPESAERQEVERKETNIGRQLYLHV